MQNKTHLPAYKDLNTYNTNGYVVTNEEPELVREMLSRLKRTFKLGGGICSGGEMAFLALMPFCDQTVLVDHGYNACASAYYKAALLSQLGAKRFRDLIAEGHEFELVIRGSKILERMKRELPAFSIRAFPKGMKDTTVCLTFQTLDAMRKEWFYTPAPVLRASRAKLHTLTIAHGDLSDLSEFGKFDLLYLSNAFGHSGRNGTPTLVKTAEPLMAAGGVAVLSQQVTPIPKNWRELAHRAPLRTSWTYSLLQYKG